MKLPRSEFRPRQSRINVTGIPVVALLVLLAGCDSSTGADGGVDGGAIGDNWLIPRAEVFDGGPGKDGIPSIDDPRFASASATSFVSPTRLVVGIRVGDTIRAYPHQVLDWHEIVNDEIAGVPIALTYCPLTGTGTAWHREVAGGVTEFGVSGLLFRNNLVPYDRATDSRWSQFQLRGVAGELSGQQVETVQVVETTWETWLAMFPNSEVLTTNTGFLRDYQTYTYGRSYLTDPSQILFPVRNRDSRLDAKDRVHGILPRGSGDPAAVPRVYPLADFGDGVSLIEDTVAGVPYVVVGSTAADFAVAFERQLADGHNPMYRVVQAALPVILEDEEGNRWDVFGTAVEGPRRGQRLVPAPSFTGYWFGWADFFPGTEIYGIGS